jgi:hypothetical protein
LRQTLIMPKVRRDGKDPLNTGSGVIAWTRI